MMSTRVSWRRSLTSRSSEPQGYAHLNLKVLVNHIRQNPQYTFAGLSEVYVIG